MNVCITDRHRKIEYKVGAARPQHTHVRATMSLSNTSPRTESKAMARRFQCPYEPCTKSFARQSDLNRYATRSC